MLCADRGLDLPGFSLSAGHGQHSPQGKRPRAMLFRTFPVMVSLCSVLETADRGHRCVYLRITNNLNLSKLVNPMCKVTVLNFGNSEAMISNGKSLLYYLKMGQLEIAC